MIYDNRNRSRIPTISIVTITYNSCADLKSTIQSVLDQTFTDYELIIIDGNSNDGTLKYLEVINENVDYILSENDEGIYHAMNKSMDIARGRWIQFLNAGDIFESQKTLQKVFAKVIDPEVIIFGKSYSEFKNKRKIRYKNFFLEQKDWYKRRLPNHQAVMVPIHIYKKEKFNTRMKVSADSEYLSRIFSNSKEQFVDEFISVFRLGGRSNYYNTLKVLSSNLQDTKYIYNSKKQIYIGMFKHIIKYITQKMLGRDRYLNLYLMTLRE